jgi:hypothetical protein
MTEDEALDVLASFCWGGLTMLRTREAGARNGDP